MRPCGMPPAGRVAHARSQGPKRWIPDQVRDDRLRGPIPPCVIPAPKPGSILQRGFTLIEVLVALGITAVALMAGLQATGSLSRNAERQTVSMLGQICADNQLIALRLRRQLPDTGNTSVECTQAGRLLQVEVSVRPTPNPNFRRVDARVLDQGAYVLQVSTVMGRN